MSNTDDIEHDDITGEILAPTAMEATINAEINQQVMTARRFPRRRDKEISAEIMSRATLNDEIARECMYSKPQGGKQVTGQSARFAEIVFASYGHLRVAARFVRIDDDHPLRQAVVVEAVCHDLQSNNARVVPNRRSIMTSPKKGQPVPFSADMINTTMAAAASIAAREAILKVVPKSIWIEAYQRVVAVIQGDEKTLVDRRNKAIAVFGNYGIKPADLFAALNVPDENGIGLDLMPQLVGMYTALKEGENVEAVLGRAREESGAPAPKAAVRSPLADEPDQGLRSSSPGQSAQGAPIVAENGKSAAAQTSRDDQQRQDPQRVARAVETVAKEQQDVDAPEKGSGRAAPLPPAEQQATQNNASAPIQNDENPALGDEPEGDESTMSPQTAFLQEAYAVIETAASESGLKDWWRRDRKRRDEAGLSSKQLGDLTDSKDDKLNVLAAKR